MPNEYLFFLSYNREELDEPDLLDTFYRSLKAALRTTTQWPESFMGFRDIDVMRVAQQWEDVLIDALGSCRVFVPLMHPRYFSKRACGQEWFAFQLRQQAYLERNAGARLPGRIVPIVWSSEDALRDVLPVSARALQYKESALDPRYAKDGLATLIRTAGDEGPWKAVVATLADRIAEAAKPDAVVLPPLDGRIHFRDLSSAWDSADTATRIAAGWKVETLCDRRPQAGVFKGRLPVQLTEKPGLPQAYLVHGSRVEVPESLLERLADVELSRQLASLRTCGAWLAEASAAVAKQVPWPVGTNLEELKVLLLQNLLERFGGVPTRNRPSAADLLGLPEMKLRRLVTIRHEIRLKAIDATFDLIRWYLDEFWTDLPPSTDRPQVILLLAAIYDPDRASSWPFGLFRRPLGDEAGRRLDAIGGSARGCFRAALPGLRPVEDTDLREWFREYAEDQGPVMLDSWVEAILAQGRKRGLPGDQVNMDLVEQALGDMVHGRRGAAPLLLKRVA